MAKKLELLFKKRKWTWEEDGMKVVRSIARTGPGCHSGCGVLLYVKDGRLIKVEGDPDFPFNQGRLCVRCLSLPQVVYSPYRLKYPMIREGERGENKWRRISWKEAYEIIAEKFNEIKEKYGPESVLFCEGTARDIAPWLHRLAFSYGSPNVTVWGPLHGAACYRPRAAAQNIILGSTTVADCAQFFPDRYDNPNWEVPKCIVIWGNNPIVSGPDGFHASWIIECMKRGSKLIVVDPRRTWLATRARIWLQIRPGTDAALALGMLNVIINEKLYDKEFVERWTYGFDKLKERVQEYPPKKVAEITWIPEEKIIEAARMYATSKPAAIRWGVAVDQSKECIPTIHAIIALWSITGNLDVPGGNIIEHVFFKLEPHPARQSMKKIPSPYPLSPDSGEHVLDQILTGKPYPIKASWIQSTNTFVTEANPKKVYEAFKRIEFNVVVDLFMTPTAVAFADIILPAVTYAERDGITLFPPPLPYIGAINKAIEPIEDCKSDMEIILELGKKLNPEAWPWENVHEWFDAILEPLGITFEELREMGAVYKPYEYKKYEKGMLRSDGNPGFNTSTGKVELYSTVFEKLGLDPLPYYEEPPESPVSAPEIAKEYPLILTTGAKVYAFFHSEHRQIPLLRQLNPDPIVEIHPETAKKLGIKDGDWVYIENRYGKCKQKAKLTRSIHPRVIHAQHGWWFPEKPASEPSLFGAWESNINLLIPSKWTGKSGYGYPFKNMLCRIRKVEES